MRRPRQRRPGGSIPPDARSGFTLLEVLLAMAILLIGMTAILSMLTFGAGLTRRAALRTASASAVDAVVADLEETLFPLEEDGSVGDPLTVEGRAVRGAPGVEYSARAVSNPDRPIEYRVDVDMTFRESGEVRRHTFSTILLREVPFGERMRRRHLRSARPGDER